MNDLGNSLQHMGFIQLNLLFGFIATYALALGRLLHGAARLRCALGSVLLAAGFASQTAPWENGAMLVVFVVGGLGMFVLAVWLVALLVAPRVDLAEPLDDGAVAAGSKVLAVQRGTLGAAEVVVGALR